MASAWKVHGKCIMRAWQVRGKCIVRASPVLMLDLRHGDRTLLLRLHALHLCKLLPPLVLELRSLRLELALLDAQLVALLLHHELRGGRGGRVVVGGGRRVRVCAASAPHCTRHALCVYASRARALLQRALHMHRRRTCQMCEKSVRRMGLKRYESAPRRMQFCTISCCSLDDIMITVIPSPCLDAWWVRGGCVVGAWWGVHGG